MKRAWLSIRPSSTSSQPRSVSIRASCEYSFSKRVPIGLSMLVCGGALAVGLAGYAGGMIVFTIFILINYFESIPPDLYRAARIDGFDSRQK